MPPPKESRPVAVLPIIALLLMFSLAKNPALQIPPPSAPSTPRAVLFSTLLPAVNGKEPASFTRRPPNVLPKSEGAALPWMRVLFRVTEPRPLLIPPPTPAWLPVPALPLKVAVPRLERPPPPLVAVLLLRVLLVTTTVAVLELLKIPPPSSRVAVLPVRVLAESVSRAESETRIAPPSRARPLRSVRASRVRLPDPSTWRNRKFVADERVIVARLPLIRTGVVMTARPFSSLSGVLRV